MTTSRLIRVLVEKSRRNMLTAKVNLQIGDSDSAVNRAYYSMFDIARAAILSRGVEEGALPRTHRGVVQVFRLHAIASGQIDETLAGALARLEDLRLLADYTDKHLDQRSASGAVSLAERFVQAVESVFGLTVHDAGQKLDPGDKVEEPDSGKDWVNAEILTISPYSLEEQQREARDNWMRFRARANAPSMVRGP
jgi:uncharacterized protein (UPF0332 family)